MRIPRRGTPPAVPSGAHLRRARALTAETELRPLRDVLLAAAVLLPVLLATPYTASPAMNWTHMAVGSVLFVLQLAVVGWLSWLRHRTPTALGLFVLQTLAGVVCFVSVLDLAPTMLQGQLVFQAAFTASAVAGLGAELRRRDTRTRPVLPRPRVRRR